MSIFRQDYHNIEFNDLLSEIIDIAEDIQGSTLSKNIFPESKKQELQNKQKILHPAALNYWGPPNSETSVRNFYTFFQVLSAGDSWNLDGIPISSFP